MSSYRLHHILILAACTIALGYWLRFLAPLPEWIRDGSGGALYVALWALLLTAARVPHAALAAFAVTCGVEFLQGWHPAWMDSLYATRLGRLALGSTFRWADFPAYIAGAALAWFTLQRLRAFATTPDRASPHRPQTASRG